MKRASGFFEFELGNPRMKCIRDPTCSFTTRLGQYLWYFSVMNYIFSKLWIAINVKQFSPVYNILVLIKELAVESTSGRSIQYGPP